MTDSVEKYKILIEPHVSEKVTSVGVNGQYVFKIVKTATKIQVRKAVEAIFKIKVARVNVCQVREKIKKAGRYGKGCKAGWKKAYVTLAKNNIINFENLPD